MKDVDPDLIEKQPQRCRQGDFPQPVLTRLTCSAILQHQPLRDRHVHDHLPDAAQRGHAHFHLAKTSSVGETQVALPLSQLPVVVLDSIILFFILFIDFFFLYIYSICLIDHICWNWTGL